MANTEQKSREEVRTFWTGPPLSNYEILSLKSFVATGARVLLYSYEKDLDVPEGVELLDANDILPGPIHEFHHSNGEMTFARHSDLFRYMMLEKFGGWYADLDIVCLQNGLPQAEVYFSADRDISLNVAVLKFPPASSFLKELLDEARRTLAVAGEGSSYGDRKIIGAPLLKKFIDKHGLGHFGRPISAAYEISSYDVLLFFDPSQCEAVQSRLAGGDFTHLWNGAWNLLRIPRLLGPPRGSFLDILFERFGIAISDRARLQYEPIESWVKQHRLLKDIRDAVGSPTITATTIDEFADRIRLHGWQPVMRRYDYLDFGEKSVPASIPQRRTGAPQILRTFWHGESIGPYQLLCLKSFIDYGHSVEVFAYSSSLSLPDWLTVRNAAEILPPDKVLVASAQEGQVAVNADLFRYALLEKLGGWWIEPDVMLLQPDMPSADIFFGTPNVFGQLPTTVLRFPPRHPLMKQAFGYATALGAAIEKWPSAGPPLLTSLFAGRELSADAVTESLGPVTWLNVPDLFDPSKADELTDKCASGRFLHMQGEVWQRAGVPQVLAPPEGAFLDVLLARHPIDHAFCGRMEFGQLNRWIRHMYRVAKVE